MNHDEHPATDPGAVNEDNKRLKWFGAIVLALATLGLVLYLVTDHGPHLLAALPYAGIIVVMTAHLFLHRGHSHGGHKSADHRHGRT